MKAAIDGATIEYEATGSGTALLLLHAFPLGLFMWDAQVGALAAACRVVRFDARGFGGSSLGEGPLTMERIADDGAALLDHLGIDEAVVGGCSMGGYAALAFVRRHPQRLLGLVLQDTRAGADTAEAKANRAALAAKGRPSSSSTPSRSASSCGTRRSRRSARRTASSASTRAASGRAARARGR